MGAKKTINRKHINIFLTALVGQSSQGRTPTRPRDKRDKMAILLWNSTGKGRFVPGTGPDLSREGVRFVPRMVPVCPGHRPAQNVHVYWFFSCPINNLRDSELLRRSIFTTPPIFTTVWTPLWGEKCLQNPREFCEHRGVAIENHCAIVNLLPIVDLLRRSIFSAAGSFGIYETPIFHESSPLLTQRSVPQNLKIPNQTIFLSGTVWQTVFFPFLSDEISMVELGQWPSD